MQNHHAFDAVDHLLRDMKKDNHTFGGATVVFSDDFQQILPVIIKGSRVETVGACLWHSSIWYEVTVLKLTENMRLQGVNTEEKNFAQWQLEVGHGKHTTPDGNIHLPQYFHCPDNSVESLIHCIYPDIQEPHNDKYFQECTTLFAYNNDVDSINSKLLKDLPGEEKIFQSANSVDNEGTGEGEQLMYPTEYLNSINASGLPLSQLKLKVGAPIMVLCNLQPENGVCNGS